MHRLSAAVDWDVLLFQIWQKNWHWEQWCSLSADRLWVIMISTSYLRLCTCITHPLWTLAILLSGFWHFTFCFVSVLGIILLSTLTAYIYIVTITHFSVDTDIINDKCVKLGRNNLEQRSGGFDKKMNEKSSGLFVNPLSFLHASVGAKNKTSFIIYSNSCHFF